MPELSRRVQTFTDSVIRRMTRINDMTPGSINLSQGFPDFDPPQEILDALKEAAEHGPHQYSITFGAKNFRDALAEMYTKKFAREIDPEKEIVVTCGGTEAMMAAMMTVCNPGDKAAVFSREMALRAGRKCAHHVACEKGLRPSQLSAGARGDGHFVAESQRQP